jgi:hypothetical protein
LGKSELRGARTLIRNVLVHLLKAASQANTPAQAHWRAETIAFQADLPSFYTPSMRRLIDMEVLWRKAKEVAGASLQEHGSSLASGIPAECPYTLAELTADDFSFDAALQRLQETAP